MIEISWTHFQKRLKELQSKLKREVKWDILKPGENVSKSSGIKDVSLKSQKLDPNNT